MVSERDVEGFWMGYPEGTTGVGVVFLAARDGMIVGGDHAHSLHGHYRIMGDRIEVTISSKRFRDNVESIWGWRDGADLILSGFAHDQHMVLGGHFAGDNSQGETRVQLMKLERWPE